MNAAMRTWYARDTAGIASYRHHQRFPLSFRPEPGYMQRWFFSAARRILTTAFERKTATSFPYIAHFHHRLSVNPTIDTPGTNQRSVATEDSPPSSGSGSLRRIPPALQNKPGVSIDNFNQIFFKDRKNARNARWRVFIIEGFGFFQHKTNPETIANNTVTRLVRFLAPFL